MHHSTPFTRLAFQRFTRPFSSSVRRLDHFPNVDREGFEKALQVKNRIVIADFYADWCGPCKVLGPILERVTKDGALTSSSGKSFDLVTIDTGEPTGKHSLPLFANIVEDRQVELAIKYEVRALPTVVAFQDGERVAHFVGALPESKVTEFLKSV